MPDMVVEFVKNIAVIQATAGISREVSAFGSQDIANAAGGVALLRGEEMPATWADAAVTVKGTASRETRQQLAASVLRLQRLIDAPFELIISGTVYPIGRRHLLTAAVRVDPEDVSALLADDLHDDLRVRLVPDPANPDLLVRLTD